jgi:hypothetical protein
MPERDRPELGSVGGRGVPEGSGKKSDDAGITPEMIAAGVAVLDWFDSDAFSEFYDSYEGILAPSQVVVRLLYEAMARSAHQNSVSS